MTVPVPGQLTYSYDEDGVTTVFAYPVRFLEPQELVVVRDAPGGQARLTYNVDYTVSGAGHSSGGSITRTAVTNGGKIIISRDTSWKQIVDLEDNARNPAEAVELQLDRLTMAGQDAKAFAYDLGKINKFTITGGTGDDILASLDRPVIYAKGEALFTVEIAAANTGNVTLNGKPFRTNSGNEIAAGGLTAGSIHAFLDLGDHYRLLSDQASAAVLAGAEAARDEAVAAASSVQSVLATRAYAIASYHPVSAPDFIDVAGYATVADGGGGRYKKVVSEPSHVGKLSITLDDAVTVVWYELVADEPNVQMFGGGTGNAATDGAALEALIAYVTANSIVGADVNIARGTYTMTEGAALPTGNRWQFNGARLDFSGVANADLALTAQGGRAHVACEGAVRGALPDLAGDVVAGDFVIAFDAAHGLAPGDVFQIYNPTDGSWSTERTYYRAGELCRVMVIVDSTTVWVDRGLYEGYAAADVELSAFDVWTGSVEGLHITGNGSVAAVTYGIITDFARDVDWKNITVTDVSYNTHAINRTMDFRVDACRGAEDGADQFAGDYGFGVYSSQRGLVTNSHFVAARHAIAHGNVGGSVPFRDIHYRYCSARSVDGLSTGWDFHSIGDHCSMEYCTAGSGLNDGVKNLTVRNCKLHNLAGSPLCYIASNQVGGTTRLIDNDYIVDGSYTSPTAAGIIHLANSQSHTYLNEDKFYDITGVNIRGYGQRSLNIVAIWTANATYAVSVAIYGIDDPDINSTRLRVLHAHGGNGGPANAKYYTIDNVKRLRSGVAYALYSNGMGNPVACRYPDQFGYQEIAGTTGSSAANGSAIVFPHAYPETPYLNATTGSRLLGGDAWQASHASLSGTGFTPVASTSDGGNFANTNVGTLYWRAGLERG